MLNEEEPPLNTESKKIKSKQGNVLSEKVKQLIGQGKNKNQSNKPNQFLAFWTGLKPKKILSKITLEVVTQIKKAKNFIVEERLAPHFVLVLLGLIVALCNTIVARGADNLYNLIPADPSSQVSIATSISRYTPLIPNAQLAVQNMISTSTSDPNSGVFTVDAKMTSTNITPAPTDSSSTAAVASTDSGPRTKNIQYTVADGDTLSGLGMRFNVKVSSIQFANNLTNADLIVPGQTLKIPPDGWEPSAAQIAARNKTTATAAAKSTKSYTVNSAPGRVNNGYPYGYCTYYVATRRAVPTQWGNAGQWLSSARASGYSTGSVPEVGAIMVSRESWYGHVAYVESVSGGSFVVAEMNYKGWGVVDRRTVSIGSSVVKGFIY